MSNLREIFGGMISDGNSQILDTDASRFGGYQEGKAVHRNYKSLGKSNVNIFTEKFVQIIDNVLLTGNAYFFTGEQERFFDEYLIQADTGELTNEMLQFDLFLAEYKGDSL